MLISGSGVVPHGSGCGDLLCANCRVRWHTNMTCRQYQDLPEVQKISEDDQATADVLRRIGFQECPSCKMLVERTEGCRGMRCRYTLLDIKWRTKNFASNTGT